MQRKYVNYGCGLHAPEGWLNYISSLTLYIQRLPILGWFIRKLITTIKFPENVLFGDITKGLPIQKNSCQGIYCSHVLEHLPYESVLIAPKNRFSLLISGGIFLLLVPDIEILARSYLSSASANAAIDFIKATHMGRVRRHYSLVAFIREWLGHSHHLWMLGL